MSVSASVPQVEKIGRPDRLCGEPPAARRYGFDAPSRWLHVTPPDAEKVLARVAAFLREMSGLYLVCRHPAVQLRVEELPVACAHIQAAGPEGCEVSRRVCEPSKARNLLANRPHAQGRGAADKRQSRCTASCVVSASIDSYPLRFERKTRRFRDGVLLTHTRPFVCVVFSPAPSPIVVG